jgi:hypothetical protein
MNDKKIEIARIGLASGQITIGVEQAVGGRDFNSV